ncbi:unnamed protein product [Caenorhabditis sp. 36 PRJEB53466]|nr:unnamed protein product [Caenorhabditis sp. 36 PRJEB53466]
MGGWDDLSDELKQKVIEYLEFRSRFRFRLAAKSVQSVVDSTPLHIPRINFIVKSDSDIQMTVFPGIDKRIRIELSRKLKGGGGAELRVTGNTGAGLKKNREKTKEVSLNPYSMALVTFKQMTMHPQTLVRFVELQTETPCAVWYRTDEILGDSFEFRAHILRVNWKCDVALQHHVARSDLVEVQRLIDPKMFTEVRNPISLDSPKKMRLSTLTKLIKYRSDRSLNEKLLGLNQAYHTGRVLIIQSGDFTVTPNSQFGTNDEIVSMRLSETISVRIRKSPCGITNKYTLNCWTEEGTEKCDKRWTCREHAHPFDYWYYKHVDENLNFAMNKSIVVEQIVPVFNGHCPIDNYFHATDKTYKLWKSGELSKLADIWKSMNKRHMDTGGWTNMIFMVLAVVSLIAAFLFTRY